MRNHAFLLLLLVFLVVPAGADEAPGKEAKNFLAAMLERVTLGDPMQSGPLVLVPLVVDKAPELPAVAPGLGAAGLKFREAAWPKLRFNVELENSDEQPLLVLGGSILVGGRLDRMAPRDLIVPPGKTLEVHMLPAEYQQRYRSKPQPFKEHFTLAPSYLRERAFANPYRNLVPTFVSHFLEFRPAGDDRLSLAAVDQSPALAKYCVDCQAGLAKFPDIAGQRVVGFITAVRGQVHSAELFGHNSLLKAYFEPLIRAHTYAAAAIELRAKRIGFPLPKSEADALGKARQMAGDLLAKLKTKLRYRDGDVPTGTAGEALLFKVGGTSGYALGYGGRLVHASVFPYDPFERRLYARPVVPPDTGEEEEVDIAELERRAASGRRLTEYEKRLLERIRKRRAPGPGDG
jgi:hypothetical protein